MLKINDSEIVFYTDEFYNSKYWFTKTKWLSVKRYEFRTVQDDISSMCFVAVYYNEDEQIYLVNNDDKKYHIFKSPSYASQCARVELYDLIMELNPLEDYSEPSENLLHIDFDSLSEQDQIRRIQIADEECS